jgi:hypothetical protein
MTMHRAWLRGVLAASVVAVSLLPLGVSSAAARADQAPTIGSARSAQLADWRQSRGDAAHRGWNQVESTLSLANVGSLQVLWKDSVGFNSSPAVANGVVYNGDGIRAFSATCGNDGDYCSPLWTAPTGYPDWASPAVGAGMVYQQSLSGLYAFKVGCRSDGGQCSPVWTNLSDSAAYSSPTFASGWLYTTSQSTLQAFDVARCAAGGGNCDPDWTADLGDTMSSAAVYQGRVFVVDASGYLRAFKAQCGTGGATCSPIWSGNLTAPTEGTPAVANGVVYVTTYDAQAYAFSTTCGSHGATCNPLWHTQLTGGHTHASVAVTDSTVYFVTGHRIFAYSTTCVSGGGTCTALWRSGKPDASGSFASSPAIANGVLYIGIQGVNQSNGKLIAFKANCATDGRTCYAVWRSPLLGGMTNSSPAVAHGQVYVSTNGGTFYAFGLPPAH